MVVVLRWMRPGKNGLDRILLYFASHSRGSLGLYEACRLPLVDVNCGIE